MDGLPTDDQKIRWELLWLKPKVTMILKRWPSHLIEFLIDHKLPDEYDLCVEHFGENDDLLNGFEKLIETLLNPLLQLKQSNSRNRVISISSG